MNLPSAGELKELINILDVAAPYSAATGAGTMTKTAARNVWAKVEPLGGGMDAETMHEQSCRQQFRIWIRYRDGVNAFQQLEWQGRRLILDGPPEVMQQWILLNAYSVTVRSVKN